MYPIFNLFLTISSRAKTTTVAVDHAKCHPPESSSVLRFRVSSSAVSSIIQVKKLTWRKDLLLNTCPTPSRMNYSLIHWIFVTHFWYTTTSRVSSFTFTGGKACGFPPLLFTFKCSTTGCVPLVTTKHCCTFVLEAIKGSCRGLLEDVFLLIASQ